MALNIGELVGYLRIDDNGVDDGLTRSERRISGFKVAAAAAGGAAGGAAGAALSTAMGNAVELDTANAKMAAQLNLTAEQAQAAGDLAGKLYAEGWGDSAVTVQDTIAQVAQNMNVAVDSVDMEPLARQAQTLADVFDVDVTESTRAAGNMMRTLGMDGSAAMDAIATVMQNGGARAADLLDTLEEYPVQFQKLGLSGETAMGILNQGMMAGARNTDIVADALKEFSIRAQDGSKSAADSYKALGLNAEEMSAKVAAGGPAAAEALDMVLDRLRNTKGQADASTIAFGLFGTQSEDLGAALYALDPSVAAGQMSDMGGAVERAGETMSDTAASKIETMKRSLEMLGAQAVATDGPLGFLSAGVAAFGPAAISMAGSFAMIGMAMGPLLVQMATMGWRAIATAATWVAQWVMMAAGSMARAAVMAASWLIAMGPVGWIIALVVGLVALIIANWDTVKAWTIAAWTAVSAFLTGVWDTISGAIMAAWNAIIGFLTPIFEVFKNIFVFGLAIILAIFFTIWNAISALVMMVWNGIVAFLTPIVTTIVDLVTGGWNLLMAAIDAANQFIIGIVTTVWNAIVGFLTPILQVISSAVSTAWNAVLGVITTILNAVWSVVQSVWNTIAGFFGPIWDKIVAAVSAGAQRVWAFLTGLWNQIKGVAGQAIGWLVDAGRNIVTGLWNGIVGMGSWLMDKITGWIKSVVPGPILSFLGIASPSRFMRDEVGRWIPEGIGVGILANARVAGDAARQLAADTAAGAREGATGALSRIDTGTLTADAYGTAVRPRGGDGASAPTVSVVVHNPLPETASDSLTRRADTLAKLGPDW